MQPTPQQIESAISELIAEYGEDSQEIKDFLEYLNLPDTKREAVLETVRDIVSIDQFMTDEYYMGGMLDTVWPKTMQSVKDVIENGYVEAIFTGGIGVAKCLGIDTPILMYDGSIKKVQDVKVNDLLMGPDSKPRRVESLARGREELFKVKQKSGDDYIVNRSHILSLKQITNNEIDTDIAVQCRAVQCTCRAVE